MHITAFAASNSTTSINKQFVQYAAQQFAADSIHVLDLNDFEMPIYSTEREKNEGIPQQAHDFVEALSKADLIVVSIAEHNGTYTAAFKNIFDWASRAQLKMFNEKPLVLLSTAPGPMGGKFALEAAATRFPRHGAHLVGTFALPAFSTNFSSTEGILDEQLRNSFQQLVIEGITAAQRQLIGE